MRKFLSLLFAGIGFAMIVLHSNYWIGFGVFVMVWAHNMERHP